MRRPDRGEDAKNLSLITISGALSLIVTVGLLSAALIKDRHEVRIRVHAAPIQPVAEAGPVSGDTRLYGTVTTRDGDTHTGFLRWDRNEGSWTDLLDADKVGLRGRVTQSGIRFGHIHRLEVLDGASALLTLKSGAETELTGGSTDLGGGLRALVVQAPGKEARELKWRDLKTVEFEAAPEGLLTQQGRIHGTLTTRSGMEFTGFITWDVDEIFTSDILDGDVDGRDVEIPFGAIASIQRDGSRGALVTLLDGEALRLTGSNDVDSSIRGISVSDPALGQVKLDWREFDQVTFWQPDHQPGYGYFDGGLPLRGTVVTESGREIGGEILWDNDEALSWEMLNGDCEGVEFHVEMGQIARIEKISGGALVELKDGRTYGLTGSNDVDDGNRGITVLDHDLSVEVEWDDFRELIIRR